LYKGRSCLKAVLTAVGLALEATDSVVVVDLEATEEEKTATVEAAAVAEAATEALEDLAKAVARSCRLLYSEVRCCMLCQGSMHHTGKRRLSCLQCR
jgi:hypothetical protein